MKRIGTSLIALLFAFSISTNDKVLAAGELSIHANDFTVEQNTKVDKAFVLEKSGAILYEDEEPSKGGTLNVFWNNTDLTGDNLIDTATTGEQKVMIYEGAPGIGPIASVTKTITITITEPEIAMTPLEPATDVEAPTTIEPKPDPTPTKPNPDNAAQTQDKLLLTGFVNSMVPIAGISGSLIGIRTFLSKKFKK